MGKNTALIGRMAKKYTNMVSFAGFGTRKPFDETGCSGTHCEMPAGASLSKIIFEKLVKFICISALSIGAGLICFIERQHCYGYEEPYYRGIWIYCAISVVLIFIIITINKKLTLWKALIKVPVKIFVIAHVVYYMDFFMELFMYFTDEPLSSLF